MGAEIWQIILLSHFLNPHRNLVGFMTKFGSGHRWKEKGERDRIAGREIIFCEAFLSRDRSILAEYHSEES